MPSSLLSHSLAFFLVASRRPPIAMFTCQRGPFYLQLCSWITLKVTLLIARVFAATDDVFRVSTTLVEMACSLTLGGARKYEAMVSSCNA
ncbi:hypothetical protein DFH07DRAFT_1063229 [Mycena maculata]|uniref:Uncharacterized protein n=1 Tax=Mycena maculata TaxID=230809 RepID=A0AAD7IKW9_9AGAR|nr:hypothetical protein DFH07DRAFT_1063229 [Mycena maculata]